MMRLFRYRQDEMTEDTPGSLVGLHPDPSYITWIDLTEPPSESDLSVLNREFRIHPLTIGALFEGVQHPRLLEYENHVFLNARAIRQIADDGTELAGLAVVLGERYVLTAHRVTRQRSVVCALLLGGGLKGRHTKTHRRGIRW